MSLCAETYRNHLNHKKINILLDLAYWLFSFLLFVAQPSSKLFRASGQRK